MRHFCGLSAAARPGRAAPTALWLGPRGQSAPMPWGGPRRSSPVGLGLARPLALQHPLPHDLRLPILPYTTTPLFGSPTLCDGDSTCNALRECTHHYGARRALISLLSSYYLLVFSLCSTHFLPARRIFSTCKEKTLSLQG